MPPHLQSIIMHDLNAKLFKSTKSLNQDIFWNELKLVIYSILKVPVYKLLSQGVSLDELYDIFADFGFKSKSITRCDQPLSNETLQQFRNKCTEILSDMNMNQVMICNFELSHFNSNIKGGHTAPIAAYHQASDRVLLVDPIMDKLWVSLTRLYQAMNTKPYQSDKYRGYLIASQIPTLSVSNYTFNTYNFPFLPSNIPPPPPPSPTYDSNDQPKTSQIKIALKVFNQKPLKYSKIRVRRHRPAALSMTAINTTDWC